MSHSTLRILAYAATALAAFTGAGRTAASVGDMSVGAQFSFGRSSPAQMIQFGGSNCYYGDGWNGRGWYQCGDEWNDGFGWVGPFNSTGFGGSTIGRHHRHGVAVAHPRAQNPTQASNPIYPGPSSQRPRIGAPSAGLRGRTPDFGGGPRFHQLGAAGVHTLPGLHAGAATVTPGFGGDGFHGGLGGGNFPQLHGAGIPHIGAPASPGLTGGGGLHGLGGATGVHTDAPASPGFAGIGSFHAGGGVGAPHTGAPASARFAGGGLHSFGGGGVFQGGGAALGQGGIGHR
jgi:hypothetical protein